MALKKCGECGNKVSTKAASCPSCGAVVKKKTGCLAYMGAAFLIAIVLGVIGSLVYDSTNESTSSRSSESTSSKSAPRPSLPSAEQIETAISASDDYELHREAFMAASEKLLREQRCTLEHFRENGGWVRSQAHKNQQVYFTYCGRPHVDDRIYLNVSTGALFK